jgi:DNA-binding transcriptional LysR family regulator
MHTLNLGCAPFVNPELLHVACELRKELFPSCATRPTHDDAVELVEELVSGQLDAALISLPINDPRLRVVIIRRDRLVAFSGSSGVLVSIVSEKPRAGFRLFPSLCCCPWPSRSAGLAAK